MAERIAPTGYAGIAKETTKGVAVTPNIYVPYYNQTMETNFHLIEDAPAVGNKWMRYQIAQGLRSHTGTIAIMAEANSIGYFMDMVSTKISDTGANPYTHSFAASSAVNPNSYTMDISLGSQVIRFVGVEASKITFGWNGELMVATLDLSALASYFGREIATVATTTLTLTTSYDPTPTTGLTTTDIVSVVKIDGSSSLATTVATVTPATQTVVLGASAAAFAAGDMLVLRPATPSYTLLQPFIWGKTQFCFGTTAANALTATQTRLDSGSEMVLMHTFDHNEGAKRSGAFDPAALIRLTYDATFKAKKFLDTADQFQKWNSLVKQAVVMRAYSGATNQYELRFTLNNMKPRTMKQPTDAKSVIYHEIDFVPVYDGTDSQGFDIKVINSVPII